MIVYIFVHGSLDILPPGATHYSDAWVTRNKTLNEAVEEFAEEEGTDKIKRIRFIIEVFEDQSIQISDNVKDRLKKEFNEGELSHNTAIAQFLDLDYPPVDTRIMSLVYENNPTLYKQLDKIYHDALTEVESFRVYESHKDKDNRDEALIRLGRVLKGLALEAHKLDKRCFPYMEEISPLIDRILDRYIRGLERVMIQDTPDCIANLFKIPQFNI